MITFKVGGLKSDADRTGVALRSESSQGAIHKLTELGLLALAIKPPPVQAVEIVPKPPESLTPQTAERFYSNGHRMQRWKLWVSSLPMSLVLGLGFYLFFTGTPQWLAGAVMLAGFILFGLVGFAIEQQRLKAFSCPGCQAPIQDWDTNETHRILFDCSRCGSRWDIGYKLWPGSASYPFQVKQRRSYFYTLCSPRGAH